ncbi:hypothetical protein D5041_14700 [Verminephrobacter aporrectodeae subsp. tuberculatae]|nr:hypothetical protein [Verminephrobacter aporrectodeae subsp. tuberculatae]MCW5290250.1 hypothetical protein [Verminephrobacter aporrectodeae subsp. tuberculatae]
MVGEYAGLVRDIFHGLSSPIHLNLLSIGHDHPTTLNDFAIISLRFPEIPAGHYIAISSSTYRVVPLFHIPANQYTMIRQADLETQQRTTIFTDKVQDFIGNP